jgi:hypothetical protein
MIDKLIEDKTIVLPSIYYNDIVFNFGGNGLDEKGNDILDIYYFSEMNEENTPVLSVDEEFINKIVRPKKNKYVVILNFESETTDVLDLVNCPDDNYEEFIEGILDYSLTNCQWIIVNKKPEFQFLN